MCVSVRIQNHGKKSQTLHDLSGWSDDFADFLDDGLGDRVLQDVWLVLGLRLLGGSLGTIVGLLHVQVGGGRSEENLKWQLVGTDFNGSWLNIGGSVNITELNIVLGLDGSVHNLTTTTTAATAVATGSAAITARTTSAAGTAITATTTSTNSTS